MATLTTKQRNRLPASVYGLPGRKAYPMPDEDHAINAKARAKQMLQKGKLTKSEYNKIVRKANTVISRAEGSENGKDREKGE